MSMRTKHYKMGNRVHSLDLVLPADRPVVTVCNAGKVSQIAADVLANRGFDAQSLAGGMKAWSLAWNVADVPLADSSVSVIQVRRTGKGCLSYIVASDGEAAVDRPVGHARRLSRHRATSSAGPIRYVLETHVHADHLSRARELAQQAGAVLLLPASGSHQVCLHSDSRRRADPSRECDAPRAAHTWPHRREHVIRLERSGGVYG